ncbi:MAG: hypothetical protein RL095_2108 [Verrucomicrobiota bacterium]|jgi:hypothetical protein
MTTSSSLLLAAFVAFAPSPASPDDGFVCPAPKLITRPGFHAEGAWARLDGEDGKPLAAHSQYSLDSQVFLDWLAIALDPSRLPAPRRDKLGALGRLAGLQGAELKQAAAAYKKERRSDPLADPDWPLLQAKTQLKLAVDQYNLEIANLNYREQLRVSDRIDLDGGNSPEGKASRQKMKTALLAMNKQREALSRLAAAELKAAWPAFLDKYTDKEPQGTLAKGTRVIAMHASDDAALAGYFDKLAAGTLARGAFLLTEDAACRLKERKTLQLPKGGSLKVCRIESLAPAKITEKDGGEPFALNLSGWIKEDQFLKKK